MIKNLKDDVLRERLNDMFYKKENKKYFYRILKNLEIKRITKYYNALKINFAADEAFKAIDPIKDVDGFNPMNVGKLCLGQDAFISCTPYGVIKILEDYNIEIEGKNAVIIGRSNIVGKPMLQCLLNKNATVTVCHSRTKNLAEITKMADILVVAIGKSKFVTKDMVKDGAVVVDVGINRGEDGKLCGDVDFEEVSKVASYITPVPGGVGPMTIAMLMNNIVKATKLQN